MNNLKRILSLALASVMLVGMMVVGASAAEFTDAADIENSDAVNSLVALKVIGGYDDGSFRPEGNVTRAQMAKMIAVALNGGNEDFRGTSSGSKFVDVKDGMWYTKFVNYCASKNIINGVDATHFNPESNVTAQEAAVMIMRAMGFRNESFLDDAGKFSWGAVNDWAESIGLYEDTSVMDLSEAANRQNAAQIIYNGIQQPTAKYTMTYNSEGIRTWALETNRDGSLTGDSILESAYNAVVEYAILTGTTYNTTDKVYTYSFITTGIEDGALTDTALAATEADYSDLYMQKVRVVYAGKDILGISAVGNGVLKSGVGTPNERTTGKIDGLTKDTTVTTVNFNGAAGTPQAWWTYDLIDNNENSRVDYVVYHPVTVAEVNVANATQVTFKSGAHAAVKLEGNNVDAGLKSGDMVVISTAVNRVVSVKKMDVVENVTATNRDTSNNYTIGGQKYKLTNNQTVTLGKTYNLSVLNGYVFAAVDVETGSTAAGLNNLIYAVEAGPVKDAATEVGGTDSNNKSQLVRFMFANGTETTIKTVTSLGHTTAGNVTTLTPLSEDTQGQTDGNKVRNGGFYTYTENSNGTYALEPVAKNAAFANMPVATASGTLSKGITNGTRFNEDAVIFVEGTYESTKKQYKMFTGAEVNEWADIAATGNLWTSKVNGFDYAVVGELKITLSAKDQWPGTAVGSDKYGYLVANADRVYVSDLKAEYTRLQIWTGTETVTRYIDKTTAVTALNTLTAGTIVKYAEANDGTATLAASQWTYKPVAVKAYAGGDTIQFVGADSNGDYTLEHAVVIYINNEDGEGVADGTITLANAVNPDDVDNYGYYNNAYLVEGQASQQGAPTPVLALFVDVNNDLEGVASVSGSSKTYLDNIVSDFTAATTVALRGGVAVTGANGDQITDDEGNKLYEFGEFEAHVGLNAQTETDGYTFFRTTITNSTTGSVKYKLVRTNAGSQSPATWSPEFTLAAGESRTLVLVCGNKTGSTFVVNTVTTGESGDTLTPLYTFTWTVE